MAQVRLTEGFTKRVANSIRRFFAQAPEQQAVALRRGGLPMTSKAGLNYNLVSQSGYDTLAAHLYIDQDLQLRYRDYESMDDYPEVSCGLDLYADGVTSPDLDREQAIWATSPDQKLRDELNMVLHKQLVIENDIWGISRTICKYGNTFSECLVNEDYGLIGLNFLPPPTVRRVEDPRGNLIGFIQDIRGRFNVSLEEFYQLAEQRNNHQGNARPPGVLSVFEDWEVIHWRLRGKHLRSIYGSGVIDPARWIWKRLSLLEDAILIYKLERAPSRYAFYVDVGQMDMERGLAYVNRVKNSFSRKKFVNPNSGELDMRYNPLPVAATTPVPQFDGREITIEEMAKEYDAGKKHWVYSIDRETGHVVPGDVIWVGKTREQSKTVRVTFDDGNWAEMAPDHPVMRRDHSYANAEDLVQGDRVMPLYRRISKKLKVGTKIGTLGVLLVVSVEVVESQDQYCMNVKEWHNFALLLRDDENHAVFGSGVFVKNSMDEDFFIPSRGGKRSTEIDVLQGPDYSETDTLEYHRDKLVSSLKIPKGFMGYGGEAMRGPLSSDDIRFARTLMRIQRVLRVGFRSAMRIHLLATGRKNASALEYDIRMNVPSQILELARVEVMSARADLAQRMKEDVGSQWILEHVYGFSEDEAAVLMKNRDAETLAKGKIDAKIERMRMGESASGSVAPSLNETQLLDRRLSCLITAVEKGDWRRDFEGRTRTRRSVLESRLDSTVKGDRDLHRRLRGMDGLLRDIRSSMRFGAASAPSA